MPLYEYICHDCGQESELLLRGSESPHCPNCQSTQLAKQFSVVAAHRSQSSSLPVCESPAPQNCGLPQCGRGQCQGM